MTHCPTCNAQVIANRSGACPWCDTDLRPPKQSPREAQRLVDTVFRASLCAQEIMHHPDLIYGVTG